MERLHELEAAVETPPVKQGTLVMALEELVERKEESSIPDEALMLLVAALAVHGMILATARFAPSMQPQLGPQLPKPCWARSLGEHKGVNWLHPAKSPELPGAGKRLLQAIAPADRRLQAMSLKGHEVHHGLEMASPVQCQKLGKPVVLLLGLRCYAQV
mmetsp:Transcript_40119/g.72078  ORF Transcript_40119/g.72078 Transcript_40119/m.72078 type:complete len:159 (-) Transcript_40119:424-900(-)